MLGIALWVVSLSDQMPTISEVILPSKLYNPAEKRGLELCLQRERLLGLIQFSLGKGAGDVLALVDFRSVSEIGDSDAKRRLLYKLAAGQEKFGRRLTHRHLTLANVTQFAHRCEHHLMRLGTVGIDSRTATTQIADLLLGSLAQCQDATMGQKND